MSSLFENGSKHARWVYVKQIGVSARILHSMDNSPLHYRLVDYSNPEMSLDWARRCLLREIMTHQKPGGLWYQRRLQESTPYEPEPPAARDFESLPKRTQHKLLMQTRERMSKAFLKRIDESRERMSKAFLKLIDECQRRKEEPSALMKDLWTYFVHCTSTNLWARHLYGGHGLESHWKALSASRKTSFLETLYVTEAMAALKRDELLELAHSKGLSMEKGVHNSEFNTLRNEVREALVQFGSLAKTHSTSRAPRTLSIANATHPVMNPTDQQCPICTRDYVVQDPQSPSTDSTISPRRLNSCRHIFCGECLDEWLSSDNVNSNCCPICRERVDTPRMEMIEKALKGLLFRQSNYPETQSHGHSVLHQVGLYIDAVFDEITTFNSRRLGKSLDHTLGPLQNLKAWLEYHTERCSEELLEFVQSAHWSAMSTLVCAYKRYKAFLSGDAYGHFKARAEHIKHTIITERTLFLLEMYDIVEDLKAEDIEKELRTMEEWQSFSEGYETVESGNESEDAET